MKKCFLGVGLLLLTGLGGCVSTDRAAPQPDWRLAGKLGVRSPAVNTSAGIEWVQSGDRYRIILSGALGIPGVRIDGDGNGVRLLQAGKQPITAESPELLLAQAMGYAFPISPLRYWVQGIPVPGSEYTRAGNELMQQGWHISYQWNEDNSPRRVVLRRADLELKLVIREWRRY